LFHYMTNIDIHCINLISKKKEEEKEIKGWVLS
jgi:hypothetical protein